MYLVRLIYASTISSDFTPEDMDQILETARRINHKNDVTGLLCFNRNYFLQCLEGGRGAVNATYHRILKDPRHDNVVLLDYREIVKREYRKCSMAYVPEKMLTDDINLMYSNSRKFDPYSMKGKSAHEMMTHLSEHIPIV
jgi:hypothetical protein